MTRRYTASVTVALSKPVKDRLRDEAKATGVSMSELLRRATAEVGAEGRPR